MAAHDEPLLEHDEPKHTNYEVCETNVVHEFCFRVVWPRTGASSTLSDECFSVGMAIKHAVNNVAPGRIRVICPTDIYPPTIEIEPGRRRIRGHRYFTSAGISEQSRNRLLG
jgi:hypothetical protein